MDPYYEWLGIPPKDQPPNHYRLLGIERFESNANVIQRAADRQMAHLRTFQAGPHGPLSQKLLNEVAAAQICLLKPEKKAAYDAQLRAQLEPAAPQPVAGPPAGGSLASPMVLWSAAAAAGVVVLVASLFLFRGAEPEPAQPGAIAQQTAPPEPPGSVAPVASSAVSTEPAEPATTNANPASPESMSPETSVTDAPTATPISPSAEDAASQEESAAPPASVAAGSPGARKATTEPSRPKPGLSKRLTNSIGMELVLIPRGQFMMGAEREDIGRAIQYGNQHYKVMYREKVANRLLAEGPQVEVTIRQAYYLGVYEVTQAQYQTVMGTNPSAFAKEDDAAKRPVENVSWNNAMEFCKRLSAMSKEQREGRIYRLPCEAEWEYACRAPGSGHAVPTGWGPDLSRYAWAGEEKDRHTHPVGTKEPNGWGLFDMHGNVAEWCANGPDVNRFAQLAPDFPAGKIEEPRSFRGGCWRTACLSHRATWLDSEPASNHDSRIGFRVAFTSEDADSVPVEPPAQPSVAQKSEPPSAEVQEPLRKQITEKYQVGQAKTAQAQVDLARRMRADAMKPDTKSDERFVLLLCAGESAAGAGDVDLMFEVAEQIDASYMIDVLLVERELWKVQADAATDAKRIESLVMAADRLLDEALVTDRLDILQELHAVLGKVWSRPAAKELRAQIGERRERLDRLRRFGDEVGQAQATLQKTPDDAPAHTTLGRWYALLLDDWDRGLPHLVQGNDEPAKAAAEAELGLAKSASPSGEDLAKLADLWWACAQKAGALFREPVQQRAAHWYQQALELLEPGTQRTAVEKRLTQVEKGVRKPSTKALPHEFANSLGMRFVLLQAGQFLMGSAPEGVESALQHCRDHYGGSSHERTLKRIQAEGPQKPVTIGTAFYLGVVEVTQGQYQTVMGSNPSRSTKKGDAATLPVENVTWNEAAEFCRRLSALPAERLYRRSYRLPCEAEWEYACRAGQPGDANSHRVRVSSSQEWLITNSDRVSHPVGTKKANDWGLFDMRGNVSEWCANGPDDNRYSQLSPLRSPNRTEGPRSIRGGSYLDGTLECRQASWVSEPAETRKPTVGFRVVCTPRP